jgi:hypothetical protein
MAIIGATELQPVNLLGSYMQGMELGRTNQLTRQQAAAAHQKAEADQRQAEQNQLMEEVKLREQRGKAMQEETKGLAGRMQYWRQLIPADPRLAPAWVSAAYSDPVVGPELSKMGSAEEVIAGIPRDPDGYMQWVEGASMFADKLAERRVLTAQQSQDLAMRERTAKIQEQQARTSAAREERLGQPAAPSAPTQAAEELPPKVRAKREELFPKATRAVNKAVYDLNRQIETARMLRNHPGLDSITGGIEGRLPSLFPSATEAQSLFVNLVSSGTLASLTDLRAASETGGALGNVSNQDTQLLTQSVGALSQAQGKPSFQRALDRYIADLEFAKENAQSAYDQTYSYRAKESAPSQKGQRKTASGTSYQIVED